MDDFIDGLEFIAAEKPAAYFGCLAAFFIPMFVVLILLVWAAYGQ